MCVLCSSFPCSDHEVDFIVLVDTDAWGDRGELGGVTAVAALFKQSAPFLRTRAGNTMREVKQISAFERVIRCLITVSVSFNERLVRNGKKQDSKGTALALAWRMLSPPPLPPLSCLVTLSIKGRKHNQL